MGNFHRPLEVTIKIFTNVQGGRGGKGKRGGRLMG
jgi:hypothetical protein